MQIWGMEGSFSTGRARARRDTRLADLTLLFAPLRFPHSAQGDAGEVRTDLGAEARGLLAQLLARARREANLDVRHAERAQPVERVDDAIRSCGRELRQ